MKKYDIYLASAMFIIALVWFLANKILTHDADTVNVYRNNELVSSYSLNEDVEFSIMDDNREIMHIMIKDKRADVTYADCPDKLCVHQIAISKDKESIVCLPNKIVISVEKNKSNKPDFGNETYKDTIDNDTTTDAVSY